MWFFYQIDVSMASFFSIEDMTFLREKLHVNIIFSVLVFIFLKDHEIKNVRFKMAAI